ncbi:hypothetical protein QJS10_CPA05g01904 [Acorus calamus]|uniref:Morc S5 domain-containing protein n=1 Tax=Acorus calamus TaxID=4465 RepID=A0AAV9EUX8_ACOCL|nr:hypothetical protein QJS10_CPA05g01904 [Acorus calamus]
MPSTPHPPPKKPPPSAAAVIAIDSDSDDTEANPAFAGEANAAASPPPPPPVVSSGCQYQTLENRSFWRVGASVEAAAPGLSRMQYPFETSSMDRARIHPKFLHSNATSHRWALGAIAELLDNAVDEICNGATFLKIDIIKNTRDNSPALLFQDDGGGMDPECIRKCMSLGFSSKKTSSTIGQYGNGFKTSTMRLGADAIVFSRSVRGSRMTESVGLLSYTFLRRTAMDDIIVPMVDFEVTRNKTIPLMYGSMDDWNTNLKIILDWSPFYTMEEMMLQLKDIGPHGTKVIVYNLWFNDDGILELDFDADDEDIRLREEANSGNLSKREILLQNHISCSFRYSLRAYASILYLRKFSNFQIILRGKPVHQCNIGDDLMHSKTIKYKPHLGTYSDEVFVEATIGLVKEGRTINVSGVNVYHKNRLIMPFWKVVCENSSRGRGVVGILEANFMEPTHDKQDFERTTVFNRLELKLKQATLDYWTKHCHLIGYQSRIIKIQNSQRENENAHVDIVNLAQSSSGDQHAIRQQAQLQHSQRDPVVAHGAMSDPAQLSHRQYPVTDAPVFDKGSCQEIETMDISATVVIDKMTKENILLYARCEEHRLKEEKLKQMVMELENKLMETKKKCTLLSSDIEVQRKQQIIPEQ